MWTLVLRDLQHRATRFVVVIVATAVVFTLLLLMTGLVAQFEREPAEAVARLGGEAWVLRDGSSGAFTSATTIDDTARAGLAADGRTDPVVVARHSMLAAGELSDVVLIGAVPGGLGSPAGAADLEPDEVAVAAVPGIDAGASVEIGGRTFRVASTVEDATVLAGMPLVFLPLSTARELVYRGQPLATAVLVEGQVTALPEGLQVLPPATIAEDAGRPLERAISSLQLIRVLLWVVAAMIVGAVVYLSALERHRDFAVLKAVGASTRSLLGGVVIQGVFVAVTAAVSATFLAQLLVPVFPLDVFLAPAALVQLPMAAVVVAVVASVAGLRRVRRADPASAFAGPGR